MNKNTKILIGSAIGIAVLGAAALLLALTQPEKQTDSNTSSEDEKVSVLSYKADDISKLTIKNDNGEFTINRLGSEKWGIDSIPEEYANNSAYGSSMTSAGTITAKMTAEKNAEDLEKYGFNEPSAVFTMTFKDDKFEPVSCTVGIKNEGENAWYFKTDKSDDVYLISNSGIKFAMGDKLDYVQLSELTPTYDEKSDSVNRIRVQRPDLSDDLVLDKLPQETEKEFASTYATYKMSSHNGILADDDLDKEVVYGLFGLSATSAVAVNPTEEQKKQYGFDNPACVASMVNNEKAVKLTVGNPVYETSVDKDGKESKSITGYYGIISGRDVIYVFSPDVLPYLTVSAESILYRLFLTPYIYYLDNVTVKDTQGKEYVFKITGDASDAKVTLDGKEVVLDRFKTFYQYMLSAYAEDIYTDDLADENKFIASFAYDYREEGKESDVVEIYSSESDRKCIFVVNGNVRYKVRQIYGSRFIDNVNALVNGGEIKQDF